MDVSRWNGALEGVFSVLDILVVYTALNLYGGSRTMIFVRIVKRAMAGAHLYSRQALPQPLIAEDGDESPVQSWRTSSPFSLLEYL